MKSGVEKKGNIVVTVEMYMTHNKAKHFSLTTFVRTRENARPCSGRY